MTQTALLPCPFCGCADIDPAEWMSIGPGNVTQTGPGCPECGVTAESVEAWNRRTAPPAAAQPADDWIVDNPPVLQRLIDSIENVDGVACWDYTHMYAVRDALVGQGDPPKPEAAAQPVDEWDDNPDGVTPDDKPHRSIDPHTGFWRE